MAEKKSSVGTFINEKILPSVMKFVNTKAVVALKDGMVYALPFIIIGSIFLILKSFPIPAVSTFFDNIGWSGFLQPGISNDICYYFNLDGNRYCLRLC